MQIYDCIVVGAGISGLSAAWALHQRGAKLLVIEQQPSVGGALRSEKTDEGFVLEHGTQTVSSSDPALWQHFAELGIEQERLVSSVQRTYVVHNDTLEPLPLSPMGFVSSRLLSPAARLRLLAEPLLPRALTPDESIATFFNRRFGPELTRTIVAPFVSGIYGGDPHELSIRAIFPGLWETEQHHGSLLRGLLVRSKRGSKRAASPPRQTFNFRNGLAVWPQAIARALGPERVWTDTTATALAPVEQNWLVTVVRNGKEEILEASRVILAVPTEPAARLVAGLEPVAAQAFRATRYPPMAAVHLGYRREDVAHPLDGMGMLCPSNDQSATMGTLWMSTIFPEHAPAGMVLTTAFVGGATMPDVAQQSEETLLALIQREQQQLMGVRGEPVLKRVAYWQRSIPQYDAGQFRRISACNRLEARWPGLYIVSNYRSGFSVEHCWQKGVELGSHIVLPELKKDEQERFVGTLV